MLAVVRPTMLYGCSSWVLTKTRTDLLNATQMRMTRTILGRKRQIDQTSGEIETWVAWVKRTASEALEQMDLYRIPHWLQMVKTRQQRWTARLEHLEARKWAKQVISLRPIGFRRVGRPVKRWGEDN